MQLAQLLGGDYRAGREAGARLRVSVSPNYPSILLLFTLTRAGTLRYASCRVCFCAQVPSDRDGIWVFRRLLHEALAVV